MAGSIERHVLDYLAEERLGFDELRDRLNFSVDERELEEVLGDLQADGVIVYSGRDAEYRLIDADCPVCRHGVPTDAGIELTVCDADSGDVETAARLHDRCREILLGGLE